jgi:hypothetical protein
MERVQGGSLPKRVRSAIPSGPRHPPAAAQPKAKAPAAPRTNQFANNGNNEELMTVVLDSDEADIAKRVDAITEVTARIVNEQHRFRITDESEPYNNEAIATWFALSVISRLYSS